MQETPGQFAGLPGSQQEPWLIEATDTPHEYHSYSGAFPDYLFNLHKGEPSDKRDWRFEVLGTLDRNGAYRTSDPQTPENFASTIYHALGIPREAVWHDVTGRPHQIYLAPPIEGLFF